MKYDDVLRRIKHLETLPLPECMTECVEGYTEILWPKTKRVFRVAFYSFPHIEDDAKQILRMRVWQALLTHKPGSASRFYWIRGSHFLRPVYREAISEIPHMFCVTRESYSRYDKTPERMSLNDPALEGEEALADDSLSSDIMASLKQETAERIRQVAWMVSLLSDQERQTFSDWWAGYTTREVGLASGVVEQTISHRRRTLMAKLQTLVHTEPPPGFNKPLMIEIRTLGKVKLKHPRIVPIVARKGKEVRHFESYNDAVTYGFSEKSIRRVMKTGKEHKGYVWSLA